MRVRVLGAGIIGLACAEELVVRGHEVEVVDRAPGSGATYAAAGMLSPAGELWHGETELFALGRSSLELWPGWAARLGVPLHATGTVLAAVDAGDLQEVDRQVELLADSGVPVSPLDRRELVEREPGLGRVVGGAWLPEDHSVDPRQVVAALLRRLGFDTSLAGARSYSTNEARSYSTNEARSCSTNEARSYSTNGARSCSTSHVRWLSSASEERASAYRNQPDVTVVATGARLPEPFTHLVRPVRGEILRVRITDPAQRPRHTVRGLVHGRQVYVVPRAGSDEVVIGATSEEHDGPPIVTVEGVHALLDAARRLLPALDRAELVEATARHRPATADHLPLIGPSGVDGVLLAAGHHRNGVLLAPLTALRIADHVDAREAA